MDFTNLERKCLDMANNLLIQYAIDLNKVSSVDDINSEFIVLLFEHIAQHNVPDLLANETKEAEAHNVQAVIDTLSMDLLGISLSYITGEDVVAGNLLTIHSLLEVLEGLAADLKSRKEAKRQNYICKRKISRKKKEQSLRSLPQDYPIVESITQIDYPVKRKINRPVKSSSSTSVKIVASLPQRSSEDGIILVKKIRTTSSSTSIESLQKEITHRSYDSSKSKSQQHSSLQTGVPGEPSTSDKGLSHDYANIEVRVPSPSQNEASNHDSRVKLHIQNEDFDLQVLSEVNVRIQPSIQIERATTQNNNVPNKENAGFLVRKMKRKTFRRPKKEISEHTSKISQGVEELYEKNFDTRVKELLQKNSYKTRASHAKNVRLQTLRRPLQRTSISPCKKSFLLPHTLRHRSIAHRYTKRKASPKKTIKINIFDHKVSKENINPTESNTREGFLQELFDEFPGLQLTPTIINHITNKYQKHLQMMHKQVKGILLKKPKSQRQAEEAVKKQSLLDNILKKDIQQQQYLIQFKENKKFENKIKYRLRDARLQSAKMKQYCDEFRTEMRKKVQKRNFAEELILENLFKESLKIQKEQVDSICQEVKETEENDARQHLIYLDALENLYQTQFSLLSESFSAEKKEAQIRAKAEQQEMNLMQREFQDELKQEIRFMQRVIVDCMEDVHFREMDAERFKTKLQRRQ